MLRQILSSFVRSFRRSVPARRRNGSSSCWPVSCVIERLEGRQLLSGFTAFKSVYIPAADVHPQIPVVEANIQLAANPSWIDEGEVFMLYPDYDGAVPLHRLYNHGIGQHYYTPRDGERDFLLSIPHDALGNGWTSEGDVTHIFTTQVPNSVPLYMLYRHDTGEHRYMESVQLRDEILRDPRWVQHSSPGFVAQLGSNDGAITQIDTPVQVPAGGNATVVVTFINNGPAAFQDKAVTVTAPGLTLIGSSETVTGGVWHTGFVSTDATKTVTLTYQVSATMTGDAVITASSDPFNDPYEPNNVRIGSFRVITTPAPSPNVAISLTGPASADTGTTVIFTVTLTNTTSVIDQNAIATIPDIAGLTYQSSSSQTVHSGGVTTFTPGFIAVGGSATATLTYQVSAAAGSSVTLNSSVTMPNDAISTDNNASRTLSVNINPPPSGADVSVIVSTQTVAAPGSTGSLVITVTNAGPLLSTGDRLTMTVPAGVSFVSADQSDITYNGTNVVWDMVFVGVNEVLMRVVNVHWDTIGTRSIVTTVTATTSDPNPNNNIVTKTIVVG